MSDSGDLVDSDSEGPGFEHPFPALRYGGCELCGEALVKQDRYYALIGHPDDSTRYYQELFGPFEPGDHPEILGFTDYLANELGILCCSRDTCRYCQEAPEAIYVHKHCLHLLLGMTPYEGPEPPPLAVMEILVERLLDFVYVSSAWRSPWRDTLYLCLDNNLIPPALPSPARWLLLGLWRMTTLPNEIIYQIWRDSSRSLVWGYANVIDMAHRAPPTDDLVTLSLSHVSSWERGHDPALSQEPSGTRMMRLTIDSDGIRSIESLDPEALHGSHASAERFDNLAFAVFDAASYPGAKVHFKYGLARLYLPSGVQHPNIWDTPLPPSLDPAKFPKKLGYTNWRFQTADLDKITALTFISSRGTLVAIHPHTPQQPSAASTVERMAPWIKTPDMWEYFPVSEVKRHLSRMRVLPRDTVAPQTTESMLTRVFTARNTVHPTSRLVWGYHIPKQDVVCIVATAERDPKGLDTVRTLVKGTRKSNLDCYYGGIHGCFTHCAPLEGVIRTQVFNNDNGHCQGILFDYADGQVAVGCCRIGVDKPVITSMPALIHIRREKDEDSRTPTSWLTMSHARYLVNIAFSGEGDPIPEQGTSAVPWASFEMTGSLSFTTQAGEGAERRVRATDVIVTLPPQSTEEDSDEDEEFGGGWNQFEEEFDEDSEDEWLT
ncbi:hypothetical protein QBC39DRAFT_344211 [Podospora conica]|nr:hypothetical protein QBC39DRAFT_344211 [Schizothecium conicum]